MAEAVERARFGLLRQGAWDELRESERQTRVGILRSALDTSGMTGRLQALQVRADQSTELADLLECREHDFRRRLAQDDAEIVRLSDRIAALTDQLAAMTASRDEALDRANADARTLASIREVLDADRPAEAPAVAADAPPAELAPSAVDTRSEEAAPSDAGTPTAAATPHVEVPTQPAPVAETPSATPPSHPRRRTPRSRVGAPTGR